MQDTKEINEICDAISGKNGWHSGRYSQNEREYYLTRRKFIEKTLYEEYSMEHGYLNDKIPVYFYIYPNITTEKLLVFAQKRSEYDEFIPKVLIIKIQDLEDIRNITFTINDSFTSYRKKTLEKGIKLREEEKSGEYLQDHNKIFSFGEIAQIHEKYKDRNPYYEVQIWDHKMLEKISWEILNA
jgi:hypothetical protein